jgi:hypothetical protein
MRSNYNRLLQHYALLHAVAIAATALLAHALSTQLL